MKQHAVKIAISVILLGGSITYLLADTLNQPGALEYFHPVDAVVVNHQQLEGERIRMGGRVEPGTILKKKGSLDYRFEMRPITEMVRYPEAKDKTFPVEFSGIVPDNFKEDAEVIVSGKVRNDGVFVAKELLAKCPSKYEAGEKNRKVY